MNLQEILDEIKATNLKDKEFFNVDCYLNDDNELEESFVSETYEFENFVIECSFCVLLSNYSEQKECHEYPREVDYDLETEDFTITSIIDNECNEIVLGTISLDTLEKELQSYINLI